MIGGDAAAGGRAPGAGRTACVVRTAEGSLFGFRLASVLDAGPGGGPPSPSLLWRPLHRPGVSLTVRWLVMPACVVAAPGHVELFVLAHLGGDGLPNTLLDEILALLRQAFPLHVFEPLGSAEELLFASRPLGRAAWSCELAMSGAARPPGHLGFEASAPAPIRPRDLVWPEDADLGQALRLLVSWPVATVLEWSMTPCWPPTRELHRLRLQVKPGVPPDRQLFYECRLSWHGAAGTAPRLIGGNLARALGVEEGDFAAVAAPRGAQWRAPLLAAHDAMPAIMPPARELHAIVPALRDPIPRRLPEAALPERGAILGSTLHGQEVRLSVEDGLRSVWCLGQTGVGKSTLMLRRILETIEEGRSGVAVFDPHADLVESVLRYLPAARRDDVVIVDVSAPLADLPGLNVLECGTVAEAHMRSGQVLEMISAQWPREMCGPMFLQASTNALLVLATRFEEPGTLAELPRVFLDPAFRQELLAAPGVAERAPEAVRWWVEGYSKYTDFTRSESMDYYISKAGIFATDPVLRAVVGQRRSTLDLRRIMDGRGILLCSLGRSGVNPLATSLLTGVFMSCALNAALSRSDLAPALRSNFFIYCDEFQRIAGPSTGAMLSELRKYGVGLFMAHQFIDQLPDDTLAAMLGNVGTKVVFRVGPRDAARLAAYEPSLQVTELTHLPNFTAFVELLVDGVPTAPFTLLTPGRPLTQVEGST